MRREGSLLTSAPVLANAQSTRNVGNLMQTVRWLANVNRSRRGSFSLVVAVCLGFLIRRLIQDFGARRKKWQSRFLRLTSPLTGSVTKFAIPSWPPSRSWWLPWYRPPQAWEAFCPNCKRPLSAQLSDAWGPRPYASARGKYAYLICLWGASPAYVLGALVLGHSIKRTNSPHARVCLVTRDVPEHFVGLLSQLWDCRRIDHIDVEAAAQLSFANPGSKDRFEHVFTKLRGLALTEFEKVLMMDIDLLVRSNVDELFDLPAPAAMRRGMNDSKYPVQHGDPIDGRNFFMGSDRSKWSWGQGSGINAGVMLWQPDQQTFDGMCKEISEPNHPEHMRGNGPEQDYLSRYWADAPWTHIGVEYNFQLHQLFMALHPYRQAKVGRADLLKTPDNIKIIHYSGEPAAKPWHRVLDERFESFWPGRELDDAYFHIFAEEFMGYWLWIRKDASAFEASGNRKENWSMDGIRLGDDGRIWCKGWPSLDGTERHHEEEFELEVPQWAADGAMGLLSSVLKEWFDALQEMQSELGLDLTVLVDAAREKRRASNDQEEKRTHSNYADWYAQSSWAVSQGRGASANGHNNATATPAEAPSSNTANHSTSAEAPSSKGSATGEQPLQYEQQKWQGKFTENATKQQKQLQFRWSRKPGGWWTEECIPAKDSTPLPQPKKASVICCGGTDDAMVAFYEDGIEALQERGADAVGVFVKVAGPHCSRRFKVPDCDPSDPALWSALDPLRMWAAAVPPGACVLLACVAVPPDAIPAVLEAISPLGAPESAPPWEQRAAFAAVGQRPHGGIVDEALAGGWGASDSCFSSHASADVAYAAKPL